MINHAMSQRSFATRFCFAFLLVIYACARIFEIAPGPVSRPVVIALNILTALGFALIHAAIHYGWRGSVIFAAICLVVSNLLENLSIATGFPFGHYYFTELMGPKLFQVPVLLGLAYIGMAYVSWTLARLVVGRPYAAIAGARIFTLPLVAGFIMVAWDLAQDPVWATLVHGWAWRDGGPWFGVPVSNYLGWFLTVFIIYLLFALYLRQCPAAPVPVDSHWHAALLFYALCAAGNLLQVIPVQVPAVVADPSGTRWRASDIVASSALVSIFVMGAFVVIAAVRLHDDTLKIE